MALVIGDVLTGILAGYVSSVIDRSNPSFLLGCVPFLPSVLAIIVIVRLDDTAAALGISAATSAYGAYQRQQLYNDMREIRKKL